MAYSRRSKSREAFLAKADALPPETPTEPTPITAGLGSTGFDPEGVNEVIERVQPVPWERHDPKGVACKDFHLRLSEYDLAILRYLAAENEDLSMQKIARRILVPELHRRAGVTQ